MHRSVTRRQFLETAAVDDQSDRLRELCKAGALGYGVDREKELEGTLIPSDVKVTSGFSGIPNLNPGSSN